MKSPYEKKLREKAEELNKKFKKEKIDSSIDESRWEEYCLTLELKYNSIVSGEIKLYYSPNKNNFKYVNRISSNAVKEIALQIQTGTLDSKIYKNKGYEIDVDGSYQNGKTAYGAIIRKDGKVIKKLSGIVSERDVDGSRQIAGELQAVIETVNWCKKKSITDITIYYDYAGIENWARGKWMAKKNISKQYAMFMNKAGMKIEWQKIKSHTGVYWNEEADKLALSALDSKT
jgi:ribonuclease HI